MFLFLFVWYFFILCEEFFRLELFFGGLSGVDLNFCFIGWILDRGLFGKVFYLFRFSEWVRVGR